MKFSAHDFLRQKMDGYDDQSPPDAQTLADWRREFSARLNADSSNASTNEQRLKIQALAVAGAHAFDGMAGHGSDANLDTFNGLVALASGQKGKTGLEPVTPRRENRSAQEDWDLAKAIVAREQGYDSQPAFRPWLRRATGMNPRELRKLIDNMDQGRGPYTAVHINARDIRERLKKGETWMFDDIKSNNCK